LNTKLALPSPRSTKSISTPRRYWSVPSSMMILNPPMARTPSFSLTLFGERHAEANAATSAWVCEHPHTLNVVVNLGKEFADLVLAGMVKERSCSVRAANIGSSPIIVHQLSILAESAQFSHPFCALRHYSRPGKVNVDSVRASRSTRNSAVRDRPLAQNRGLGRYSERPDPLLGLAWTRTPFRLIFRSQRGEKRSDARRASAGIAPPLSSSRNTADGRFRRARRELPKRAQARHSAWQ